ncbi:hypothetical protein BaRGS_00026671, partial [Batillaria attramentaria]
YSVFSCKQRPTLPGVTAAQALLRIQPTMESTVQGPYHPRVENGVSKLFTGTSSGGTWANNTMQGRTRNDDDVEKCEVLFKSNSAPFHMPNGTSEPMHTYAVSDIDDERVRKIQCQPGSTAQFSGEEKLPPWITEDDEFPPLRIEDGLLDEDDFESDRPLGKQIYHLQRLSSTPQDEPGRFDNNHNLEQGRQHQQEQLSHSQGQRRRFSCDPRLSSERSETGLWAFIRRRFQSKLEDKRGEVSVEKPQGLPNPKMKKFRGLPISLSVPNFFSRRAAESGKLPVYTVSEADVIPEDHPVLSGSPESATGGRFGLRNPAFLQFGVPRIPLRRRSGGANEEPDGVAGSLDSFRSSRSPSPFLQLTTRNFRTGDDDTASITSSMTSLSRASSDDSQGSDDSIDSANVLANLAAKRILKISDDDTLSEIGAEGESPSSREVTRAREANGQGGSPLMQHRRKQHHQHCPLNNKHPHHSCINPLGSSRCQSVTSLNQMRLESELQGPQGVLFTAKIFNRIGRKNSRGEALRGVTHVSHVYQGTMLMTDILDGKISFVASSGRAVKEFVTEAGSEPWCACITPRGHVAVTLRRQACVTVWCGNGTLVREFGHDVLKCPTGLACDRKGRFIVSDEQTNKVAFFSPTGEFLGFLCPPQPNDNTSDASGGDRNDNDNPDSGCGDHRQTNNSSDDAGGGANSNANGSTQPHLKDSERKNIGGSMGQNSQKSAGTGTTRKRVSFHDSDIRQKTNKNLDDYDSEKDDVYDDDSDSDRRNSNTTSNHTPPDAGKAPGSSPTSTLKMLNANVDKNAPKTDYDNAAYTFSVPRYVCVTGSGKIVVSDSGNHCVKVFSPEGEYLHRIGSYGTADGQLKVPYGVCSDHEEHIYVADHYNDRVSVFSLEGEFLQHVLTSSSGLSRPKSVAMRPSHIRKLYIAHGGLRSNEVLVYQLLPRGRHSVSFTCAV